MILQSLCDLYHRISKDPDSLLPRAGYSLQNITFCVMLNRDGSLLGIEPRRIEIIESGRDGREKKTFRPLPLPVPGQAKSPGLGLNPCLLWDTTAYLLGYKPDDDNPARTQAALQAFKRRHLELEDQINSPSFSAVCRFLENWRPSQAGDHPSLAEIGSGFGVFQIAGETTYVHETAGVVAWWEGQPGPVDPSELVTCLVTGKPSPLALIHDPPIKGVAGTQAMGAKLVSFKERAYESFGKEGLKKIGQGRNAPVGREAAFAYCNSLNWLLARKDRHFRIGDATAVFWTDQATPLEGLFPWLMAGVPDAEGAAARDQVRGILERIALGTLSPDELGTPSARYFMLCLSPNTARLSVRFWHTGTVGELIANLRLHFRHLSLIRQWDVTNSSYPEPFVPSACQLLRQTARDADGIPPLLVGGLMRAILLGTRYPHSLVTSVMNRIRMVERSPHGKGPLDNVTYLRAAILKAWLIRNTHTEITTMLDESNANPGYRLGRLFAILETTQQDAFPGLNATLRVRFYAAASATPRAAFGRLLRTCRLHLTKLPSGVRINREKKVEEILSGFADFPAHLPLQDQARFALGYYHQQRSFFTRKEPTKPAQTAANP